VSLELFGHPFSSCTQKVLIALYADATDFQFRMLDQEHPENMEELRGHWPFGRFPLLLDDGTPVIETTPIIEHLQAHYPGPNRWIRTASSGGACASSIASSTCAS
jgi:glutathione S-transferase